MELQAEPLDISDSPDLLRLAEEVHASKEPRVLARHGESLVALVPLPQKPAQRRGRRKTEADYEAFRAAAGGWADVDTDKLIEDIYADRRRRNRPPIDL